MSNIKLAKASAPNWLSNASSKFNTFVLTVVAALLLMGGPAYTVNSETAAPCSNSNGQTQCFYDSAGITHNAGYAHTVKIYASSIGYVSRTVWDDGGGTNLYSWVGPGTPVVATNVKVCWQYIAYTYTSGSPAKVVFDVVDGSRVLWASSVKSLAGGGRVLHDGHFYYNLQQFCQEIVHVGGTASHFSMLVKDASKTDSYINIYKTTWTVLD